MRVDHIPSNFLKAAFYKIHLGHSWILNLNWRVDCFKMFQIRKQRGVFALILYVSYIFEIFQNCSSHSPYFLIQTWLTSWKNAQRYLPIWIKCSHMHNLPQGYKTAIVTWSLMKNIADSVPPPNLSLLVLTNKCKLLKSLIYGQKQSLGGVM